MTILSLYDGMSCGNLAFRRNGIRPERYVAFEIEEKAVITAKRNFPDIDERGDVFAADFTEFDGVDFLIGGSPCTYWSIAQKPGKREKTASGLGWDLFSQYLRALREARPRFFIYENNASMDDAIRQSICEAFGGFPPVQINSSLVSAQSRERLYWVGRRGEDGKYHPVNPSKPADRGIIMRDILDTRPPPPPPKPTQTLMPFGEADVATTHRVGIFPNRKGEPIVTQSSRFYDVEGKGCTLTTHGGVARYAVPNDDGKHEVRRGFFRAFGKTFKTKLPDGRYDIRHLTLTEQMRMQTVPADYQWPVAAVHAMKMLGNGWTVEVIAHLIRQCLAKDGGAE